MFGEWEEGLVQGSAVNFLAEGSQTKYIDLREAEESTLTQIKVLVLLSPSWQVKKSKWF